MRPSAEPWPCRSIVIILKESFARSLYNTKQQIDDEEIYERAINKLRRNLKADLNLCDSCVCWCRVPHREAMDKESFARSLYRDGSHEFLTSDLVVETLATDPKRGNIHLFACLVNHASVAWILSLTGCLWVTTPASIVQKLTSVRVTTVQVHDVAWKSQSACPCIRNYGCIQRGG